MESISSHPNNVHRHSNKPPQEIISDLHQRIETQDKLITFLRTQYDRMKQRVLELLEANSEIRDILKAHVGITRNLLQRENLSPTEQDLLRAFEKVRPNSRKQQPSGGLGAASSRGGGESLSGGTSPAVKKLDSLSEFTAGRKLSAKKENWDVRDQSHFELPTISNGGAPISDITVIKRRKSFISHSSTSSMAPVPEVHPHMEILLKFPLFKQLTETVMERIASSSYEMRKKARQVVITKGDDAAEIFFLLEGAVAIHLENNRRTHLKAGSFFGELGVLFKFKRTATVTAIKDCILLVITKQKMDEAINSEPQLSKLVENFAAHKDDWWKDQKYLDSQESFGAEFAHDIARKDLRKVPMFASAPESFIQSLAMKTQCFVAEPNQSIVSIGEESDAIYFVLTGTLQVVGSTGAIHAEMTDASVRAKVKSHIFKLSKSDLLGVISGYPVMEVALNNAASERYALMNERDRGGSSGSSAPKVAGAENDGMTQQTQHFPDQFDIEIGTQSLAKLSIFNGVDSSVVTQLSMKMTRKTWPVSEMIIKCGDIGDGMYFLAAGNAEVITEFGEVIDSVSGPSAYFGEVALLEHVPRTASVKCTSVCSTYELRKSDFLAVMERYTDVAKKIKETADARMQKYLMRNVLA